MSMGSGGWSSMGVLFVGVVILIVLYLVDQMDFFVSYDDEIDEDEEGDYP